MMKKSPDLGFEQSIKQEKFYDLVERINNTILSEITDRSRNLIAGDELKSKRRQRDKESPLPPARI